MGRCKVCGHRGMYFKYSFYCPVLDKKNPHITLEEELTDPGYEPKNVPREQI